MEPLGGIDFLQAIHKIGGIYTVDRIKIKMHRNQQLCPGPLGQGNGLQTVEIADDILLVPAEIVPAVDGHDHHVAAGDPVFQSVIGAAVTGVEHLGAVQVEDVTHFRVIAVAVGVQFYLHEQTIPSLPTY